MSADIKDGGFGPKKTPRTIDAVGQFPSFFTNEHHVYAARKAERLAAAVHVVTGFMAPNEPLRATLRTLAIEVVGLITDPARLVIHGIDTFGTRCAEIGSMLETSEAAGLVSGMNARMIVDEYARLAVFVRDRFSLIRGRVSDLSGTPPTNPVFKGQKDIVSYKTESVAPISDKGQGTNGRRSDILSLLNSRDKISIKDATQAVPNVSEKTLQRELLAMVADGTLIKEGERRWSTYKKPTSPPDSTLPPTI